MQTPLVFPRKGESMRLACPHCHTHWDFDDSTVWDILWDENPLKCPACGKLAGMEFDESCGEPQWWLTKHKEVNDVD